MGERVWSIRRRAGLAVLVTLSELPALGYALVGPALSGIAHHFATDQVVWVITAYSLGGTVAGPLLCKLGDLYGMRRMMLIATGLSALGSLGAALAPSFGLLIAARCVQGAGFAAAPLAFSLVRRVFPERALALSIGILGSGVGIVGVGGPLLAGQLIDNGGYRAVFWAVVGVAAVAAPLLPRLVEESPRQPATRIDLAGAGWLALSGASVLLALSNGAAVGWSSWRTLGLLLVGAAAVAAFFRRERRAEEPLIAMSLLTGRGILPICLSACAYQATISTVSVVVPMMLMTPVELGPGYARSASASEVALLTTPGSALTFLTGIAAGWFMRSGRIGVTLLTGSAALASGSAALALFHADRADVLVGYCLIGLGAGMLLAATPMAVIASVPAGSQAIAAGSMNMLQSLGSTAGLQAAFAVLGTYMAGLSGGSPVFTDAGYRTTLLFATGLAVLSAIAVTAWRPARRRCQVAVPLD